MFRLRKKSCAGFNLTPKLFNKALIDPRGLWRLVREQQETAFARL